MTLAGLGMTLAGLGMTLAGLSMTLAGQGMTLAGLGMTLAGLCMTLAGPLTLGMTLAEGPLRSSTTPSRGARGKGDRVHRQNNYYTSCFEYQKEINK